MSNKFTFFIGILGVSLFIIAAIVGGFLIDDYNLVNQYISETYAIDTKYGKVLRIFGFIPSGILITIFCFLGFKHFPTSKLTKIGFYGLGVFYGIATLIVGLFPCDSGCNPALIDPSIAQIIHNLVGLLTYIFVPVSIIIIGIGLKKSKHYNRLSIKAIICGVISISFILLLFADSNSEYKGLYQRIIEAIFIIWIIICAMAIKNKRPTEDGMV